MPCSRYAAMALSLMAWGVWHGQAPGEMDDCIEFREDCYISPGAPAINLAKMTANLKTDPDYYTKENRDITNHAPNIGVGP